MSDNVAAPRLPVPKNSLAAAVGRRSIRTRLHLPTASLAATAREILRAIEPWYDWGKVDAYDISSRTIESYDASEYEARRFEFQWLRLNLAIHIGRMPRAPRSSEEAATWAR